MSTYVNVPDVSPRLSDHIPVGNLICLWFLLILVLFVKQYMKDFSSCYILAEVCLFHTISWLCRQSIAARCPTEDIHLASLNNCPSIASSQLQTELKEVFQRSVLDT